MKTIKERAAQLLKSRSDEESIGDAFALLEELTNAPEPEPVAVVRDNIGGALSFTCFGAVDTFPVGMKLYAAPPAPSVPDTKPVAWQFQFNNGETSLCGNKAKAEAIIKQLEQDESVTPLYPPPPSPSVPDGWKHDCAGILQNDVELWVDSCPHCGKPRPATPTPAEAPADVARDAERLDWLDVQCSENNGRHILCLPGGLRAAIDAAIAAEKGGA